MAAKTDMQVSLLPFRPEDVTESYVGWLNDPAVMDQTEANSGTHTLESTRNYVEAALGNPDARLFRIMAGQEGHVGNLRISEITRRHQRADIALIIGRRDLWGRGIAPAAIRCAVEIGFSDLGLHKLTAGMYHTNEGSIRAFLKAGFREEGRLPEHYLHNGSFVDRVALGLLRSDWERNRG
jgi:RimJ/RimL family protein N-acetyltransferase